MSESAQEKLTQLAEGFDSLWKCLDGVFSIVGGFVLLLPFQAYVFSQGWQWFITPVFGLSLTYWQAFGIWCICRFATHQMPTRSIEGSPSGRLAETLVHTLLVYGTFAVVAHCFL